MASGFSLPAAAVRAFPFSRNRGNALFVSTQFPTQNRYTLLLELLYRWAEQGMDS
jgi:hypothetical protein